MTIQLNGAMESIPEGTTIAGLLAQKGVAPAHVVVERNSAIVSREEYQAIALNHGDTIELFRFVGGG